MLRGICTFSHALDYTVHTVELGTSPCSIVTAAFFTWPNLPKPPLNKPSSLPPPTHILSPKRRPYISQHIPQNQTLSFLPNTSPTIQFLVLPSLHFPYNPALPLPTKPPSFLPYTSPTNQAPVLPSLHVPYQPSPRPSFPTSPLPTKPPYFLPYTSTTKQTPYFLPYTSPTNQFPVLSSLHFPY